MSEPQQGIFGIDLGTTYSVVGYIDETGRAAVTRNSEGDDTTPSVVYFENEDNVVVGKAAKAAAGQYPEQVVSLIKREMGDREYRRTFFGTEHTPPSISAIILEALANDAEEDTGRKVTDAVITVPAYFGLLEKDATRQGRGNRRAERHRDRPGAGRRGAALRGHRQRGRHHLPGLRPGRRDLRHQPDQDDGDLDRGARGRRRPPARRRRLGREAVRLHRRADDRRSAATTRCGTTRPMLQDLRIAGREDQEGPSPAETQDAASSGTRGRAAKITVTREQFEEMTADLLDETIRITKRTLAEAEEQYPGIRSRSAQLLLVGGSSRMPAVSDRLRKEFGWDPRLADPDLAVAKGAALYAAGQTVRYVETDEDSGQAAGTAVPARPRNGCAAWTRAGDGRGRRGGRRSVWSGRGRGPEARAADRRQRPAQGDRHQAAWTPPSRAGRTPSSRPSTSSTWSTRRPSCPFTREPYVASTAGRQPAGDRDRDLGAGRGEPGPGHGRQPPAGRERPDQGPGPFALPAGSPINIDIKVDAEGTVHLKAVEPRSNQRADVTVRISILSEEQVDEAKRVHAGLTVST